MHHQFKIQQTLLIILFLSIPISGFAENSADELSNLFISSSPLNAVILIDGEPLLQTTPALTKGLTPGAHLVSFRKDGFAPVDMEIDLPSGQTEVITAQLSNNSVIVNLPGAESVYLRTDTERRLPDTFRLPEGGFNIKAEGSRYYIEPVYPNEALMNITGALYAVSVILLNAAIVREFTEAGELNLPHSLILTTAEVSNLLLGAAAIAFDSDKKNFMRNYRVYSADLSRLDSEAETLYQRAQRALSVGNLEDSLSDFSRLIGNFPDSARFPESLYKIAKIHIISGDTNLAVSELRIIIENFPDAGIYDKACQTLALLYFNNGQPDKSRESVNKMVYYDQLFSNTRQEIEAFGIDEVIENWARNPERQAD